MITFKEYLIEKLDVLNPKDQTYHVLRQVYKTWDKERYKQLFDDFKSWGFLDKRSMRLYYPLSKKKTIAPPNNEVVELIKSKGYDIIDYNRGILQKSDSKGKLVTSSIQSVLSKYKKELESVYLKDPHHVDVKANESSMDDYLIVISRHPYDIIGMSSGRDWEDRSCMNLKRGAFKHIVPVDVQEGSLVAYLIKATDKDLQEPVGRLTIRPYLAGRDQIVFGVATKGYYIENMNQSMKDLFYDRVSEWVSAVHEKQKLSGIFKLTPGLYRQESRDPIIVGKGELTTEEKLDLVRNYPKQIVNIQGYIPEKVLLAALEADVETLTLMIEDLLIDPSDKVLLKAIELSGKKRYIVMEYIFDYLFDRDIVVDVEDERLTSLLKKIIDLDLNLVEPLLDGTFSGINTSSLSDEFLEYVVSKGEKYMDLILLSSEVSPKVLVEMMKEYPYRIEYIYSSGKIPPIEAQIESVSVDGMLISIIMDYTDKAPDKRVQIAAIENDENAIEEIESYGFKVSDEVRKAAGVKD